MQCYFMSLRIVAEKLDFWNFKQPLSTVYADNVMQTAFFSLSKNGCLDYILNDFFLKFLRRKK